MALPPVVNFHEGVTRSRLQGVAERRDAEVLTKVRVADALPVNGSGISNDLFGYSLRAHFDCLVTDLAQVPLFAVEYDGPHHDRDERSRENDRKKNALCERFGLPLARVRDGHLFQKARGINYLSWLAELYFTGKWLSEAQERGDFPADEPVDPMMVMLDPTVAPGSFPLWLSRPARLNLEKLHGSGVLGTWSPLVITGEDSAGTSHCMAIISLPDGRLLSARASVYLRGFGLLPGEAAKEFAIVDLDRRATAHAESGDDGAPPEEVREAVINLLQACEAGASFHGGSALRLGFKLAERWMGRVREVRVGELGSSPEYVHRSAL